MSRGANERRQVRRLLRAMAGTDRSLVGCILIRNKIPTRRCWADRALSFVWHKLETSWLAVAALYAVIFAIVFAANYWS